jgi:hypothetical protein
MAYELRPNQGNLFVNKRKNTDKQPDMYGELNFKGTIIKLSAWRKRIKDGTEMISIAVNKYQKAEPKDEIPPNPETKDDSMPF